MSDEEKCKFSWNDKEITNIKKYNYLWINVNYIECNETSEGNKYMGIGSGSISSVRK